MINPFKEVNWTPGRDERRKFAVSLMIGFPILAAVILAGVRIATGTWQISFPLKLAGIGAGLGAFFWLVPVLARPFYVIWYFAACSIGLIIGNLLLVTLYYTLVTGTGLGLRLFGRSPISKGPNPAASTYWADVEPPSSPGRYFQQF